MTSHARLRELATTLRDDLHLAGEWGWRGNLKHGSPWLSTSRNGLVHVLGLGVDHRHFQLSPDWSESKEIPAGDCDAQSCPLNDQHPDEQRRVCRNRATLQLPVGGYANKLAREIAEYEVCPEATSEDDPRLYRHDIVGLRSPVAQYLAAVDADTVLGLLDEIDALREQLRRVVMDNDLAIDCPADCTCASAVARRMVDLPEGAPV